MTASQCSSCASETGPRERREGEGSERWSLISWRRRFVEGEREGAIICLVEECWRVCNVVCNLGDSTTWRKCQ